MSLRVQKKMSSDSELDRLQSLEELEEWVKAHPGVNEDGIALRRLELLAENIMEVEEAGEEEEEPIPLFETVQELEAWAVARGRQDDVDVELARIKILSGQQGRGKATKVRKPRLLIIKKKYKQSLAWKLF